MHGPKNSSFLITVPTNKKVIFAVDDDAEKLDLRKDYENPQGKWEHP